MSATSILKRLARTGAGCALLVALGAAAPAGLQVSGGWFRSLPPPIPAAGYFTLHNTGDQAAVLVGADSPACGSLMLHRSIHKGGTDQMVMVEKVTVPAHGAVHFAPGGYHLMCMQPNATMKHGAMVPVTLEFSDGASLAASFAVRNARGQ